MHRGETMVRSASSKRHHSPIIEYVSYLLCAMLFWSTTS
uniref:Uncharacterized protein n=1 Tax=Arundo donax TaxID=35708 RepID=A0A0A9H281_ARUDO